MINDPLLIKIYESVINEDIYRNEYNDILSWNREIIQKLQAISKLTSQGIFDEKTSILVGECKNLMSLKSVEAFNKFQRFHELEYKRFILKNEYPEERVSNLLNFTEYEMLKLFDWLSVFLKTVINTRYMVYGGESIEQSSNDWIYSLNFKQILNKLKNKSFEPWRSLAVAIHLLNNASTLDKKIEAITISLNIAHDSALLLIKDPHDIDKYNNVISSSGNKKDLVGWMLAPFSLEQYNNLNYINSNKVKREIQKDLG